MNCAHLLQLMIISSGMIRLFNMPILGWLPRPRKSPGGSILKLAILSLWLSIIQKPYSFSNFSFSSLIFWRWQGSTQKGFKLLCSTHTFLALVGEQVKVEKSLKITKKQIQIKENLRDFFWPHGPPTVEVQSPNHWTAREFPEDQRDFSSLNTIKFPCEQYFTWVFKCKETCYGFFPSTWVHIFYTVILAPKMEWFGASLPSADSSFILYSAIQFKLSPAALCVDKNPQLAGNRCPWQGSDMVLLIKPP